MLKNTLFILGVGIISSVCFGVVHPKYGRAGENFFSNPDFINGSAGWNYSDVKLQPLSYRSRYGNKIVKLISQDGQKGRVYPNPQKLVTPVQQGREYVFSAWVKTSGDAKVYLVLDWLDGNKKPISWPYGSTAPKSVNKWGKISLPQHFIPENAVYVSPVLYMIGKGVVLLDRMEFVFNKPRPAFLLSKGSCYLRIKGLIDESYLIKAADKKVSGKIRLFDPLVQNKIFHSSEFDLGGSEGRLFDAQIDVRDFPFWVYRMKLDLLAGGKVFETFSLNFIPGIDDEFTETSLYCRAVHDEVGVNIKEGCKVEPTVLENEKGIILFNRDEPRWIQPDSIPLKDERIGTIKRTTASGDYVFVTFAAISLREFENVQVLVEPVAGASAVNWADAEVGHLRYWSQQTAYGWPPEDGGRVRQSWIVPELIEPMKPHDLHQGRVEQYSIKLKVPDEASGKYCAKIAIKAGEKVITSLDLDFNVLPVKLGQPEDVVFGIYMDEGRWLTNPHWYTDARILGELKMLRSAGFNSILWTFAPPLTPIKLTRDGKYYWGMREVSRYMKLAMRAGFDTQPHIVDPYALERMILKQAGKPEQTGRKYSPDVQVLVDQAFEQLRKASQEGGWPEIIIHGLDEASHGNRLDASIRILEAARKHGFKTSATTYDYAVEPELGKYLDFPIYSMPGFWCARDEKGLELIKRQCKKFGNTFWYYGAGCYANETPGQKFRKARQEGCISENRYMNGLFLYRTGAKASWAWTLMRYGKNPYNDFDGAFKGEYKESCIVYPGPKGYGIIPTLQFEALRLGWQDYLALYTLEKRLESADASVSEPIRKELDSKIAEIPWQNYTQYPSGKMEELRGWVLKKINELKLEWGSGVRGNK